MHGLVGLLFGVLNMLVNDSVNSVNYPDEDPGSDEVG